MLHSMRETIGMNKRAIGIWWRESPGMLVALIFYVITGAVLPYAGIYFSAQIITELAGAKNPVVLRNLVLLLLGIESLLGLIYHYFKNRYTVERNRMLEKLRYNLSEKKLSLDFEKVDVCWAVGPWVLFSLVSQSGKHCIGERKDCEPKT